MRSKRLPEYSVNQQHTLCNMPEERGSQIQISCPDSFRTCLAVFEVIKQQVRQCTYKVTMRRVRVTIVAVEQKNVLNAASLYL